MRQERFLELVWEGDIAAATGAGASRLQRGLSALLPLRIVTLAAAAGVERRQIMPDSMELMPALPLGDVLAEELNIDVPLGSLVVVSEAELLSREVMDDELSYDLGVLVAEALIDVIRSGAFPLERESDALYVMASSYHAMIGGGGFLHLGLMPSWFRIGLAAGLCTYWVGTRCSRSDTSGLFLRPDFLSNPLLHDYLHDMDANFTSPSAAPLGLMLFTNGPCTYDAWLAKVTTAVTQELDLDHARARDTGRWTQKA